MEAENIGEADDTDEVEGAAGAAGSSSRAPGRQPARPEPEPDCVPSDEEDEPDDDFEDSNCDGIDGDINRAIFVDPEGADANDGAIDAPVATLSRGIELARAESKDVYLCAATYEENVVVEEAGIRIYSGYDCEDGWRRKPLQATVAPFEGRPLTIRNVTEPVLIDRVQFLAPAAVGLGESSVAALVVDSVDVRLSRLDLVAGEGAPGEDAEAPVDYTSPPAKPPDGRSAEQMECLVFGAAPAHCTQPCSGGGPLGCCGFSASTCPNDCRPSSVHATCQTVISGTAGRFRNPPSCPGDNGNVARSFAAGGNGGNGYISVERTTGTKPTVAADAGAPGASGAPANDGFGSIGPEGDYVPSNSGMPGRYGKLGAAGDGGDGGQAFGSHTGGFPSNPRRSGAGGLGGAAGCGGRPGLPGSGGGASIALLSVRSSVELERALLRTASGGPGGHPSAGGAGQPGGPGSAGGTSNQGVKTAADGKEGHEGGPGGAGGPGGGGPSIGVVAVGPEPLLMASVFDVGPGGPGADPIQGSGVSRGAGGLSQDVYVLELPADE